MPGEIERRDDDPAEHGGGQVGEHRNHRDGDDYQHVVQRDFVQHSQRSPGKRLLRHHEHHPDQGRQRDALDQRRQEQDEQ
ncbi:hypothetical protein D3C86_2128080 [compost metagenome]